MLTFKLDQNMEEFDQKSLVHKTATSCATQNTVYVYTIGVYYISSIFGLLVKFGQMVWLSGHEYLTIGFLFIRLSRCGPMYLSQKCLTLMITKHIIR